MLVANVLQTIVALTSVFLAFVFVRRPRAAQAFWAPFSSGAVARFVLAGSMLLAAISMIVSIAAPFAAFFASAYTGMTAIALGGYATLCGVRAVLPASMGLLLMSLVIAVLQPLGLKVLCLPKADLLPYEPVVEVHVIKTYGEGVWFESVRVGLDGTLYLAANTGLDFARSDYFAMAHGEVIARQPNGSEHVLFTTPPGSTAGVLAVASDGTLFMTSHGATSGIWRIAKDGTGQFISRLPAGAWPNGLDFGPDGKLYSTDSAMGVIWRIDPVSGKTEQALVNAALSARPFVAIAPGANGLHFNGRDMIVTVSDSAQVLRFHMDEMGRFTGPQLVASGIPGDDFAIGPDGSLLITTHPYDTLVQVTPEGRRSIIADARQHIIGATDAAFGRTAADRDVLYVTTDGGAFTGGAKTRGQLIALKPYAPR